MGTLLLVDPSISLLFLCTSDGFKADLADEVTDDNGVFASTNDSVQNEQIMRRSSMAVISAMKEDDLLRRLVEDDRFMMVDERVEGEHKMTRGGFRATIFFVVSLTPYWPTTTSVHGFIPGLL